MKKIGLIILGSLMVSSCAPSYQIYNRKQYPIKKNKNEKELAESKLKINYSKSMVINHQAEDAKIISGWSEEKKKWFAENFFYKDIFFRNDTLVVIK